MKGPAVHSRVMAPTPARQRATVVRRIGIVDAMKPLPTTVTDPRNWLRFAVSLFPAVGGGYGIALALGVAVLIGSSRGIGTLGALSVFGGLALGLAVGVIAGTVDGFLVRSVPPERLRQTTSIVNGLIAAVLVGGSSIGFVDSLLLHVLLLVVGPGVAIGLTTWRRSPMARSITG